MCTILGILHVYFPFISRGRFWGACDFRCSYFKWQKWDKWKSESWQADKGGEPNSFVSKLILYTARQVQFYRPSLQKLDGCSLATHGVEYTTPSHPTDEMVWYILHHSVREKAACWTATECYATSPLLCNFQVGVWVAYIPHIKLYVYHMYSYLVYVLYLYPSKYIHIYTVFIPIFNDVSRWTVWGGRKFYK